MRNRFPRFSLLVPLLLAACTPNGGDGQTGDDSGTDSSTDSTFDAPTDTRNDAGADSRSDVATETGSDSTSSDATGDGSSDGSADAMGDTIDADDSDGCALPGSTPKVTPVGKATATVASAVITAASGGTITTADGRAKLQIPAGALSADTTITLTTIEDQCPGGIHDAYRIGPAGTTFAFPATLTFHIPDSEVFSSAWDAIGIANQHADDEWYPVGLSAMTWDHTSQNVSAQITDVGDWAPFATIQMQNLDFGAPPAMFVDDSVDLGMFSVTDTSSTPGPLHDWTPTAGIISDWAVNGIAGGDSTVGTITTTDTVTCFGASTKATYHAPSEVPTAPVFVSGNFAVPGRGIVAAAGAQVSIFYHHYSLDFHYRNHNLCPTSSTVQFDDDNGTTTAAFSLDAGFKISLDSPGALTTATVTDMNVCTCPTGWSCTYDLDSSASPVTPGVEITDAAGGFEAQPMPIVPFPDASTRTLHMLLTGTFSDYPATVSTDTPPFGTPTTSRNAALQEPFDPVTYSSMDGFLYVHGYDGEVLQFNKVGPGPCAAGTDCDEWTWTLHKAP